MGDCNAEKDWCRDADSNCGPTVYETVALPAELSRRARNYRIGLAWQDVHKSMRIPVKRVICRLFQ